MKLVNQRPDSRQGTADLLDRALVTIDAMRIMSEGEIKITLNEIQEAMSYAWDELTRYESRPIDISPQSIGVVIETVALRNKAVRLAFHKQRRV